MTRETAHCTFCDLIHGAAEVSICHEDADAIAFMDIQPVNNGHVLVVPRHHYESLLDVPPELSSHLFKVTMRLASAVQSVSGCRDMNIVVNSGAEAGQDEPHFHVHIIPRRDGDGFNIPLPFDGSSMPDRTVLDAYAARIIVALDEPPRIEPRNAKSSSKSESRERSVDVPRFDDNATSDEPRIEAAANSKAVHLDDTDFAHLRIEEGAQGELQIEPARDRDEAV